MTKLIIVFILLAGCTNKQELQWRFKVHAQSGDYRLCNQMNNYYGLMVFEDCEDGYKYVNPNAFKMINLK